MTEQTYLKILRWGIYLTLLAPLLVFKSLLFPFITSKTFYFRILIEILLAVYILFIYQYPKYIPKKKAISIFLLLFSFILILTSFTGVDFNLSFWSDVERMEGAFGFIHLATYFFIIISVFKTKKDWERLLQVFLGISCLMCLYGFGQKLGIESFLMSNDNRISSTLGNSSYLGAISLFGFSIALIFSLRSKELAKKLIYAFIAIVHVVILLFTGTRGSYLGFIVGTGIALILYIILLKKKKIKIILMSVLAIFIISGSVAILKPDLAVFRKNYYVYRLTHFSLNDATWNTRLISWKAGLKGFSEKPLLGIGSGNYAYFFDKYFPPSFYTFTARQTYFDHAHNTIVDIAVTTGLIGILTYLAILGTIIYYLILNFKKEKIDLNEFIILISLLAAYFMQNLFVFDCLVTFMAFFIIAGYISFHHFSGEKDEKPAKTNKFSSILAIIAAAFSLLLIFEYNLIPAKAMALAVNGQQEILNQNNLNKGYETYKKALSYETVLDRDIRSSFINSVLGNALKHAKSMEQEKLFEIVDYSIDAATKNLKLNPKDTLLNLQAGQLLNLKFRLSKNRDDLIKANEYLMKALAASPGRLQIHFVIAENVLLSGDKEKALKILEEAKDLNLDYSESYVNLSRVHSFFGENEKSFEMMGKAVSLGYQKITEDQLHSLIKYFTEKNNFSILSPLYSRLLASNPKNAKIMAKLAAVYAQLGKKEEAVLMVKKAVEIDTSLKESADIFIKQLGK